MWFVTAKLQIIQLQTEFFICDRADHEAIYNLCLILKKCIINSYRECDCNITTADHPSRGVLLIVVCLSMMVKP